MRAWSRQLARSMVALLWFALIHSATASPDAKVQASQTARFGADAWATIDRDRSLLLIRQPAPAQTVLIRVPSTYEVDLNSDSQVICGTSGQTLWRLDASALQLDTIELENDPKGLVATARGDCAVLVSSESAVVLLQNGGQKKTIAVDFLRTADSENLCLGYDDVSATLMVFARENFALVAATPEPTLLTTKHVIGTVKGLPFEEARFSSFRCETFLSADRKTLIGGAYVGDSSLSRQYALASVDVRTGSFTRYYLPRVLKQPDGGRRNRYLDRPMYDISSPPIRNPASREFLYVEGRLLGDDEAETVEKFFRVNTITGAVHELKVRPSGSLMGFTASGRYAVYLDEQINVANFSSGKIIDSLKLDPRDVVISHGARATPGQQADDDAGAVLQPRSGRVENIAFADPTALITDWVRRAASIAELRRFLFRNGVAVQGKNRSTQKNVSLDIVEVLGRYLQPSPDIQERAPRFDQTTAESPQAWKDFTAQCTQYAAHFASSTDEAFLRCALAPL